MDLLSTMRGHPMPVHALVEAADLFGFTANSLRVALARLLARGLIERNDRGQYLLAKSTEAVQRHVTMWTRLEERTVAWRGGWLGCHTAGLSRTDRTALRRRQRALNFLGFRELDAGLWVRPDNLRGGVDDVRARLYDLGLDEGVPVFELGAFDAQTETRARALWDATAIRQGYTDICRAMKQSGRRLGDIPVREAMAEAFVLGGRVIHLLVFDPLLPEPLVPAAERRAVITTMREYDRVGRNRWREFMIERGAAAFTSHLRYRPMEALSLAGAG